jgi:hypothetical protein
LDPQPIISATNPKSKIPFSSKNTAAFTENLWAILSFE